MGGSEGHSDKVWSLEILYLEILACGDRGLSASQALRAPAGGGTPTLASPCHLLPPVSPEVVGPHGVPPAP